MRYRVLPVFLVVSGMLLWTGCQGPDEERRPVRLHVDPNLLTTDFGQGARSDAAGMAIKRAAVRYTAGIFPGSPMPTGMPPKSPDSADARLEMLGKALTPPRGAPAWSKGVEEPPRNTNDDVPRQWTVRVKRGENLRILAKWAGTTLQELRAENRSALGRRRYARAGDKLVLTLSANQKYAFDQERDKYAKQRVVNYFATRYVDKVVVYQVKRGDSILKAAKSYGDVPLWLLSEFNQRNFRRLRPNELILIPVVKRYESGQKLPGQLVVVDENGQQLADTDAQAARQKMNTELLGRARVAIDDGNVFERRPIVGAQRADPVLSQRPGLQPAMPRAAAPRAPQGGAGPGHWSLPGARLAGVRGAEAPGRPVLAMSPTQGAAAAPPAPVKKMRSVLVKKRETLGHYRAWSGLSTRQIKDANPGLNPNLIFIGKKIKLPMSDSRYAEFVQKRTEAFLSPRERERRATRRAQMAAKRQREAALQARLAGAPKDKLNALPRPLRDAKNARRRVPAAIRPAMIPNHAPSVAAPANNEVAKEDRRWHIVKAGDTVSRIAKRWRCRLEDIKRLNPGMNIDVVRLGARVRVR